MKGSNLFIQILNLILKSDKDSAEWVKVTSLRRCFYLYIIFHFLALIDYFIVPGMVGLYLETSVIATRIYRFSMFFIFLGWIILTMTFAYYYYRYVLSKGAPIILEYILYFYFYSVFCFGASYFYIYLLFPNLFIFDSLPSAISPTFTRSIPGLIPLNFFLFSAFQSVHGSYYRIHVNSALISIMTYIQSVFTIALIALFISSYVNQKTNKTRT
jgi:hypothetical protein